MEAAGGEVEVQTPSHVEALSRAFRTLAENIQPVLDVELFLQLGDLVLRLLSRIRRARLDLRTEPQAARDLLATQAALLAAVEPAPIPRYGIIQVNISNNTQTR